MHNKLYVPRKIYDAIMGTIGTVTMESGGILAVENDIVTDFYFDYEAGTGNRHFQPTAETVTRIASPWMQEGKLFGYIHSHRPGLTDLSPMDFYCAQVNLSCNKYLPSMYMVVVCDGLLYPYRVFPGWDGGKRVERYTVEIIEEEDTKTEVFHLMVPQWFSDAVKEKIKKLEEPVNNELY